MSCVRGLLDSFAIHSNQNGSAPSYSSHLVKAEIVRFGGLIAPRAIVFYQHLQLQQQQRHLSKFRPSMCSFSSSQDDADYVKSTVLETVEVKSDPGGLLIKMRNGKHLKCVRNNPLLDEPRHCSPHLPTVLKMEDHTRLLLPLFWEMPSAEIARKLQTDQPTMCHVMKHMIEKMEYEVERVRITRKIDTIYCAELHIVKLDRETKRFIFDMRLSDAIDIALRHKVPIQVNKYLAFCDGMRILNSRNQDRLLFAEMDSPSEWPCIEAKEFDLVQNMVIAANDERYGDAALWRDRLTQLRSDSKGNWI